MTPDEFDALLHDAEVKLARLRALYEQWFTGIEKLEPTVPRKDLERTFENLRKGQPRNTALRFRLQQTVARYGTYVTYWQRISRQIEEGTYRRDLQRVRERNLGRVAELKGEPSAWEIDVDVDEVESSVGLDETDIDAILGALGQKEKEKSLRPAVAASPPAGAEPSIAPAPVKSVAPRGLSPFVAFSKPKPTAPPAAGPSAPVAPPPAAASTAARPAPSPSPTPATPAARPAAAMSFAKPAASPPRPATPAAAPTPAAAVTRPTAAVTPAGGAPRPAAPSPAAAPPRSPPGPGGLDDRAMRTIYEKYADARRKNNEGEVRYEQLQKSVEQMLPKLREKHAGKKIDFEVVVANGRVGLKPRIE